MKNSSEESRSFFDYITSTGEVNSDDWARCIGHFVFNHEKINNGLRDSIAQMRDALDLWRFGYSPRRLTRRDLPLDPLEPWVRAQSTSDLRRVFCSYFCTWLEVQGMLLKNSSDRAITVIGERMAAALTTENDIRNNIVHGFVSPTSDPFKVYHSMVRNSAGQVFGKSEIRVIDWAKVINFLELQLATIEALEELDNVLYSTYFICEPIMIEDSPSEYHPDAVSFASSFETHWLDTSGLHENVSKGETSAELLFNALIEKPSELLALHCDAAIFPSDDS